MSLGNKLIAIAGTLLCLAVAILLGYNHYLSSKAERAVTKEVAATSHVAATKAHESATIKLDQDKEKAHAAVDKAIEVNRTWADTPVPDAVADLMRAPRSTTR